MKFTALLEFIVGATTTTNGPEVAFAGMLMLIEVALQEFMVTTASFSSTALLPCVVPNPEPLITTCVPTAPVFREREVISGAGADAVLTETLSKLAVATAEPSFALTARPM